VIQNEDVKFVMDDKHQAVESNSSNDIMIRRGPKGQPTNIVEDPDEDEVHTPPGDY